MAEEPEVITLSSDEECESEPEMEIASEIEVETEIEGSEGEEGLGNDIWEILAAIEDKMKAEIHDRLQYFSLLKIMMRSARSRLVGGCGSPQLFALVEKYQKVEKQLKDMEAQATASEQT